MKEPLVTELRLPNRPGFEQVAMSAVASVAELAGYSSERIGNLKTEVAEACVAAFESRPMEHCNPVVVTISMGEDSLEISVGTAPDGAMRSPE